MGDFGNAYDELDQMDVHQAVTEVLTSVLGENVFSLRKVRPLSRGSDAERHLLGTPRRVSGHSSRHHHDARDGVVSAPYRGHGSACMSRMWSPGSLRS